MSIAIYIRSVVREGMNAADGGRFPLTIRRADFFVLMYVVAGAFYLLLGGWYALTDGITVDTVINTTVAAFWLVLAGYLRRRPNSMDRGTDPTPRRWVELAALVGGTLAVVLAAVFAIETLGI
jgi:hypothetical protein